MCLCISQPQGCVDLTTDCIMSKGGYKFKNSSIAAGFVTTSNLEAVSSVVFYVVSLFIL